MNDSDKRAFAETLTAACAVYDRKPMEKPALQLYWQILTRFTIEQFHAAMSQHLERSKFFPKPAEIVELIEGSTEDNATDAYRKVAALVGSYDEAGNYIGADNKPRFDCPRLQRTVDVLWRDMCLLPHDEQHWVQKRFEEVYASMDGAVARERIVHDSIALPDLGAKYEH